MLFSDVILTSIKTEHWTVHPQKSCLEGPAGEVSVPPRVMEVLVYLIEHRQRVVTAEELMDRFWPGRHVETSTIHRTINKVRRALGDASRDARFVRTFSKRGYQYVAAVTETFVDSKSPTALVEKASQVDAAVAKLCVEGNLLLSTATTGRVRSAVQAFDKACTADRYCLDGYVGKVVCQLHLAQMGDAWWECHEQALQARDSVSQFGEGSVQSLICNGLLHYMEEHDRQARSLLCEALELAPDHSVILFYLAKTHMILGEYRKVVTVAQRLVNLDPLAPAANMILGEGLRCIGQEAKAQHYVKRAAYLGADDPGVLVRAARFALWSGNFSGGAALAKAAYDVDPEDKRGATNLAALLMVMGDLKSSAHWSKVARARDPYDQSTAYWRAPNTDVSFQQRRDYVEGWRLREAENRDWLRVSAEIELDFARSADEPGDESTLRETMARAYDYLAEYLQRGGELSFDEAGLPCEVIFRNRDYYSLLNFGLVAERLGRRKVAFALWEGMIHFVHNLEDGPCDAMLNMVMFVSHVRLRRVDESLVWLQAAWDMGGLEATLFDLVGITDDVDGLWHQVGETELYQSYRAAAQQNALTMYAEVCKLDGVVNTE